MSTVLTVGKRVDPKMVYNQKPMERMTSFVVYALMQNLDDLGKAIYLDNREFHYLDINPVHDDLIDVMIVDISGEQFELVTRKTAADNINSVDTTAVINVATYLALKNIATWGFKHKYLQFTIPDSQAIWEVSVFLGKDGQDHPWVRCELFTDDITNISELPFPVQQFTVEGDPENPKEAVDHIQSLWSHEYSRIDDRDVIKT